MTNCVKINTLWRFILTKKVTNAERFISAYNAIDHSLRSLYNFKKSLTFTDVIRKSVMFNSVIRKYEDDLLDYGRLRNAIIHRSNSSFVIAEPHLDVVEKIEKLADIISTPPLALDRISNHEVLTMPHSATAHEIISLMARSGYSNIPIYKDNFLIGIANGQRVLDVIGLEINNGNKNIDNFLRKTNAQQLVERVQDDKYYVLADQNLTIEEAMQHFETNRKLLLILITQDGQYDRAPLGVITITDVVEMQKVLNVY